MSDESDLLRWEGEYTINLEPTPEQVAAGKRLEVLAERLGVPENDGTGNVVVSWGGCKAYDVIDLMMAFLDQMEAHCNE